MKVIDKEYIYTKNIKLNSEIKKFYFIEWIGSQFRVGDIMNIGCISLMSEQGTGFHPVSDLDVLMADIGQRHTILYVSKTNGDSGKLKKILNIR